ncbi:hypothetical protein [Halobacterium salinarum]|uniref:hypothetical protein n=1 Tax=Halobacterium salinarum TaxID=2242 RepID=UPI001F299AE5|nr:hypothetical protein [Halobacterium salinarum]MCF2165436.1 hypothetical protein [Halobacterium salinarum]MCF2168301.1 hypothetical protein [Halobacterium salinarum]
MAQSATPPQASQTNTIPADADTERVSGGTLVYRDETEYSPLLGREKVLGRQYLGFTNVTDWDALRSTLAARGLDVGALYHLPEFDQTVGE